MENNVWFVHFIPRVIIKGQGRERMIWESETFSWLSSVNCHVVYTLSRNTHRTYKTCKPFPSMQGRRMGDTATVNVSKLHFWFDQWRIVLAKTWCDYFIGRCPTLEMAYVDCESANTDFSWVSLSISWFLLIFGLRGAPKILVEPRNWD